VHKFELDVWSCGNGGSGRWAKCPPGKQRGKSPIGNKKVLVLRSKEIKNQKGVTTKKVICS